MGRRPKNEPMMTVVCKGWDSVNNKPVDFVDTAYVRKILDAFWLERIQKGFDELPCSIEQKKELITEMFGDKFDVVVTKK